MNNQKLLDGIFDRFVFSKQATFIVVLLGPLLSILTFLAFNIVEEESKSDFLKIGQWSPRVFRTVVHTK